MLNLKKILMKLGNRLVTERSYTPASMMWKWADDKDFAHSTGPIDDFTRWLNQNTAARELLEEMGIYWPVVNTENRK